LEILALLLLGLIAMLVIVPPIIRGKLAASPLASSLSFQRSMQEMGNSLEPQGREEKIRRSRPAGDRRRSIQNLMSGVPIRPSRGRPTRSISRAEMRRRRLLAMLTLLTIVWGAAALAIRSLWCLVIFGITVSLSLAYLTLSVLISRLSPQPGQSERADQTTAPPKRQAM